MIDLRGGQALHARAGRREAYLPVAGVLGRGEDPLGLARAFKEVLGFNELYIADLDAIAGGAPDLRFLRALADEGIMTWVDAGIKTAHDRRVLHDSGATFIVAATETLPGSGALAEIAGSGPVEQIVFSLDLQDGRSKVAIGSDWASIESIHLVEEAASLGIRRLLVLETTRMGSGQGFGHDSLICEIHHRMPTLDVAVGGGVSGIMDVRFMGDLGVSQVLVGSALHDGRINRAALDRLADWD